MTTALLIATYALMGVGAVSIAHTIFTMWRDR